MLLYCIVGFKLAEFELITFGVMNNSALYCIDGSRLTDDVLITLGVMLITAPY